MRVPLRSPGRELGINMTPMIDVVFLLIIFFLVSSHLSRQEAEQALALPAARTGHEAEAGPRFTLNVLPDGQFFVAGTSVSPAELPARIETEIVRHGPDLEIRIRADRQAPYRAVEPVLLACARAGAWNVTFAVLRQPEQQP